MIIDRLPFQWIYIVHSNPDLPYKGKHDFPKGKEEYLEHWGKWVVFGEKKYLDELARQLDTYVEERHIHSIKYLRQPPFWMGFDQPVICVFCDDRERGEILQLLQDAGVMPHGWESERRTIAGWLPGGEFLEKMIAFRKLTPEEAEKVRRRFQQYEEGWLSRLFRETDEDLYIWNLEQLLLRYAQESHKLKNSGL